MSNPSGDTSSAATEEPTPEPSSAVVAAGTDVPEHLRSDPFVRYMMEPPAEDIANLDAMIEAGEIYGEDYERALADLRVGQHPVQRHRDPSR